MNRPPSASSGANAIACSAPSTPPQRSRSDSVSAARSSALVHVELEHVDGLGQPLRRALGHPPAAPEARQHDRGALLLRLRGGVEGDRVLGDHAGDQQPLAVEDHSLRPPRSVHSAPRQALARLGRLDELVDEPGGGRRLGPQVLVGVLVGQPRRARLDVVGGAQLAPVDDPDRGRARS